ncbi:MAG TPA: hypothetical protein VL551_15750 [Actinospica sp.]|nr:hypothetical protein [Actinospica sp.]
MREAIGTWLDQQGHWIVLMASGRAYMDPAMDNKRHVTFHDGMSLDTYYAGAWALDSEKYSATVTYADSWNADVAGPIDPQGGLTWCSSQGGVQLIYGAGDPDSPCAGLAFTRT